MERKIISGRDFCKDYLGKYKVERENKSKGVENSITRFNTNLKILDLQLRGGFQAEQFVVLGGVPGTGKTALTLQIAAERARQLNPILLYNVEASPEILFEKIISTQLHIKLSDIQDRNVDLVFPEDFIQTVSNIFFCDLSNLKEDSIKKDLDFILCENHNLGKPVMIFDYVQRFPLLNAKKHSSDIRYIIESNITSLKALAVNTGGLVIAVSSLNRDSMKTGITMNAFKESADFEFAGDVLIGMATARKNKNGEWVEAINGDIQEVRADATNQVVMLKLLKVKHYKEGNCLLNFYRNYQKFGPFVEEGKDE